MHAQEETPQFLLIVRERLRPGTEEAYAKNELEIASSCAALKCPHPYLALVPVAGLTEVWWLSAFASEDERREIGAAYARNEPLMARLGPLGKRKEDFRETLATTLAKYRFDLSRGGAWRVGGARFVVVDVSKEEREIGGAVFESTNGQRFTLASADSRATADRIALRAGRGSMVLAVQPQWSFPAEAWIAAEPAFWHSNPVVRNRTPSPDSR